jgi:hypothetical protein
VLVMVAAYSRFIAAMMIPSRVTGDLLAGMWQLIADGIGGVPRTLLWDNESGIGQRGRLAQGVAGFCGVLGTRLIQARITGNQGAGGTGQRLPADVISARPDLHLDRRFQRPTPRLADDGGQQTHPRHHPTDSLRNPDRGSGRDGGVAAGGPDYRNHDDDPVRPRLLCSLGGNAYSVHPEVIGRMITVRASLDRITAHCGERVVDDHQRLWGTAGLIASPEHVAAAAVLREQFRNRPTAGAHLEVEVEVADLGAYDAVFGTGEVARWPPNAAPHPVTPTS